MCQLKWDFWFLFFLIMLIVFELIWDCFFLILDERWVWPGLWFTYLVAVTMLAPRSCSPSPQQQFCSWSTTVTVTSLSWCLWTRKQVHQNVSVWALLPCWPLSTPLLINIRVLTAATFLWSVMTQWFDRDFALLCVVSSRNVTPTILKKIYMTF